MPALPRQNLSISTQELDSPEYLDQLKDVIWTDGSYRQFIADLKNSGDDTYRQNMLRLIPTDYEFAGIRMGKLRKLAHVIARSDPQAFLDTAHDDLYESMIIQAYIMGIARLEYDTFIHYLEKYIPLIDNWALADMTVHYKIIAHTEDNKQHFFSQIKNMLSSNNMWEVRVGLVALLKFYNEEQYRDEIFKLLQQVDPEEYYVPMGIAWLLATLFEKHELQVLDFLRSGALDNSVIKLAIRKIKESRKTTDEQKKIVNEIRDDLD